MAYRKIVRQIEGQIFRFKDLNRQIDIQLDDVIVDQIVNYREIHSWIVGWILDSEIDRQIHSNIDKHLDRQIHSKIDKQLDKQIHSKIDKQLDRQISKYEYYSQLCTTWLSTIDRKSHKFYPSTPPHPPLMWGYLKPPLSSNIFAD